MLCRHSFWLALYSAHSVYEQLLTCSCFAVLISALVARAGAYCTVELAFWFCAVRLWNNGSFQQNCRMTPEYMTNTARRDTLRKQGLRVYRVESIFVSAQYIASKRRQVGVRSTCSGVCCLCKASGGTHSLYISLISRQLRLSFSEYPHLQVNMLPDYSRWLKATNRSCYECHAPRKMPRTGR